MKPISMWMKNFRNRTFRHILSFKKLLICETILSLNHLKENNIVSNVSLIWIILPLISPPFIVYLQEMFSNGPLAFSSKHTSLDLCCNEREFSHTFESTQITSTFFLLTYFFRLQKVLTSSNFSISLVVMIVTNE
jgi:hypothetical protein